MGAVSVTWDQCRAMAPQNCCCHLQVWGNPLVLLSCLSPVSRDTAGFGGAGSPPPPCQGGPGPISATLSRSPGDSQTPFQDHEGLCAVLGSERGVSDKGGSGGGGWCSSSFPAGTKAKQTESVSVSVSVPIPCPCPRPDPCPHSSHVWCGAGNAPGAATEPLPRWVPVGTPAPRRLGAIPAQPRGPPGAPLAAGIGAMAFQLEERWRWQCVLGATSCHLSVLPASPWWLRPGPGPPGCPIPDGWVAPRRWHHPHSPAGCRGIPGAAGDAGQESPASGAGSGRGEAAWRGSVGAVTCHRPPGYPETCRSTRLKQASMRGRRAGGEGHPIHREKVPQRQGWGLEGTRSTGVRGCVSSVTHSGGVRGPIQPPPPPKIKNSPLAHHWEHPLLPGSTLWSPGASLVAGPCSRLAPGRGEQDAAVGGSHSVAFPLWASMMSIRLSGRDWQDTGRSTGDGGGVGGIYMVHGGAPAGGDAFPHLPPEARVSRGRRCGDVRARLESGASLESPSSRREMGWAMAAGLGAGAGGRVRRYSITMQHGRCWEKYLKSSGVAPGQLVSSSSSSSCSCTSPDSPVVVSKGQPARRQGALSAQNTAPPKN